IEGIDAVHQAEVIALTPNDLLLADAEAQRYIGELDVGICLARHVVDAGVGDAVRVDGTFLSGEVVERTVFLPLAVRELVESRARPDVVDRIVVWPQEHEEDDVTDAWQTWASRAKIFSVFHEIQVEAQP